MGRKIMKMNRKEEFLMNYLGRKRKMFQYYDKNLTRVFGMEEMGRMNGRMGSIVPEAVSRHTHTTTYLRIYTNFEIYFHHSILFPKIISQDVPFSYFTITAFTSTTTTPTTHYNYRAEKEEGEGPSDSSLFLEGLSPSSLGVKMGVR